MSEEQRLRNTREALLKRIKKCLDDGEAEVVASYADAYHALATIDPFVVVSAEIID